ncbi:MAG: glycosyltransferase family 4 protein [Patescibacteria group bacterium]
MSKKRIAVLMNAFWTVSGGDQRAKQILKRISNDFEIDCYVSRLAKSYLAKGTKGVDYVVSPDQFNRGNVLRAYCRRSRWAGDEMLKCNYDLIYATSDFFPDVWPATRYRQCHRKTRWVQVIHHIYTDWRRRPGNKLKNLLAQILQQYSFRLIKKHADLIITVNNSVKMELITAGFDPGKIKVNPNGVDTKYFDRIKVKKVPLQACFLARLNLTKGIYDLVEIWAKVAESLPKVQLKIIGGGGEEIKRSLQNRILARGLGKNIEICGYLPDEKAYALLKSSQVFVFPSHEEGWGIAIAEAMACGVPVVAWNLPVYHSIFGSRITAVKENDIDSFAQAVINLLTDNQQAKGFGDNGHNFTRRYSCDNLAVAEKRMISRLIKCQR